MDAETRPDLAHAFDSIGERYGDAFTSKPGQLTATDWVVEQARRLDHTVSRPLVIDVGCGTGLPTARRLIGAG